MFRHFLLLIFLLGMAPHARGDIPPPPPQPSRVVSLKPNITKTLVALGSGKSIVGITKFCPRPNETAEVVADYTSIRAETIVRLKPDLVLSSTENSQSRQYEPLTAAGLNVRFLKFDTLEDLFGSVEAAGELTGKWRESRSVTGLMRRQIESAKAFAAKLKDKTFAVIVQREPLMVSGGASFISTLLESAGLTNAFGANRIPYPVLDKESLLAKKPDLLFDMGMTRGADWGTPYLGRSTVKLDIEDFLAAPQSAAALEKLLEGLAR